MYELSSGTVIRLTNGKTCRIKEEIGRGGQGYVYLVEYQGVNYALKWYVKDKIINSNAFYENLIRNAKIGSPASNFLWPIAITEKQEGSYGYIMMLKPQGYEEMSKFLLCKAIFSSLKAQINACLEICMAFQLLHIRGLSYQDMNDGNILIHPQTGNVLICDNDNIAPDGTSMGIMGKVGFMAPEIIEGDAKPNKYTDYFSMAICLFILIYMNRPFEGIHYLGCSCIEDKEMEKKLFGYESVFIMDPQNSSNRPVKDLHTNVLRRWPLYPNLLRNAFIRTFSSKAIKDPTQRLIDKQWCIILSQIRSYLISCPYCGKDTFVENSLHTNTCTYCKKPITNFNYLSVGHFLIPLVPNQIIYDCQVRSQTDYLCKAGEVLLNKGILCVINTSTYTWTAIHSNGNIRIVSPGDCITVELETIIKFGNCGKSGVIINSI